MTLLLKKPSISQSVSIELSGIRKKKKKENKRNKELERRGVVLKKYSDFLYFFPDGSHVHVLVRRDQLRASKVMADRLLKHPKVTVHFNTSPTEALGENGLLSAVATFNNVTKEAGKIDANGLFYAIGHEPATSLVKGQVELDVDGYIKTVPGSTITNVEGLYAAGDVQDKRYRQAITSAGSGCMAALDAERYLSEREA